LPSGPIKFDEFELDCERFELVRAGRTLRPSCALRRVQRDLGRAYLHWDSSHCLLRHRTPKEEVLARLGLGGDRGCVRSFRSIVRIRFAQLPHSRHSLFGWKALNPERRKNLDYQRRIRRPFHRLRQGRWREVHRFPDRTRFPRLFCRRGRAQDGHPRILDLPSHSRGLQGPRGKCARRDWEGTSHRF
jgi:hypothetical protein